MGSPDFYKALFEDAFCKIEDGWEADAGSQVGHCWTKCRYPYKERFRIEREGEGKAALSFTFCLPEPYLNSRIVEEVKRYRSAYQLSIIVMNRKPSLVAKRSTAGYGESILEFIHGARAVAMDILERIGDSVGRENDRVASGEPVTSA